MNKKLLIVAAAVVLPAVVLFAVLLLTGEPGESGHEPPFAKDERFVVCLDAGHGGGDPGATDAGETRFEKDDNLALALAVRDILSENEIEVFLTRGDDSSLSLDERCEIANEGGASVFISLHRNSGGGTGVEVWISKDAGSAEKALGKAILDRVVAAGVNNNRGLRRGTANNPDADYAVIRGTEMISCIVEMGFIDSSKDNDVFDTNLPAYAAAIAEGIMAMIS